MEALKPQLPENAPRILLGAEVRYYQGISRLEGLKKLTVEGSKLLLLEMPMGVWTESMVRELVELSGKSSVRIVLAHVERYLGRFRDYGMAGLTPEEEYRYIAWYQG